MAGRARRVFLSHTVELREFPRRRSFVAAAEAAVSRAGDVVADMAYFSARDTRPAEYCRRVISQADVFVAIVGLRYGSLVDDQPDRSYVELEFDIATERGLPRLVFLLDEDAELPLPASRIIDSEHGGRQAVFRQRLIDAGLLTAAVATPAELEAQLYQALVEVEEAAIGPNAGRSGTSVAVPLGQQPIEVRGREELLGSLLDERGLIVLAGMGGMGKSTVAAELTRRVPSDWPVWWVSAADSSSLTGGMVTVARRIGAGEADLAAVATQAGDAPDRFWVLLEQTPVGWLLVLDNADDPELLAVPGASVGAGTGWSRSSRRGIVLVTCRQADIAVWGRHARVHRLQPLSADQAANVLMDLAPHAGSQSHAEALAHRLGVCRWRST